MANNLSAYDIERVFNRIENELIDSMMRNLDYHKRWEAEEGFEWSMWQAEQLKTLEKWRKANQKKYSAEFKTVNQKIEQLLRQSYNDGQFAQEREILEFVRKGFPTTQITQNATESIEGAFFKLNDRKLETLIKATTNDFEKAEIAVLRRANDQYRKIIFDAQVYANTGAGTYQKAVDMATKDFISRGIDCIQYKNGARHSISDYAEMAIRTASKRAYLQGEGIKRQEWGISTVIVHKRNGPCPKCLPFVGKVFVDDVWSGGNKDGKSPVTGAKYPLLSSAVAAGLYHPNCKDGHSTYYEGISDPPDDKYTKDELNKLAEQYKAEEQQQYAKRQQEKYERLEKY
ncbi:MAG: phage minor capsid protein, partial [Lachnospiraceae bacterium]